MPIEVMHVASNTVANVYTIFAVFDHLGIFGFFPTYVAADEFLKMVNNEGYYAEIYEVELTEEECVLFEKVLEKIGSLTIRIPISLMLTDKGINATQGIANSVDGSQDVGPTD